MEENLTYQVIVVSFTMPLILAGILIWFVIIYQKKKNEYEISRRDQKLREQDLIIQRQQALTNERTRIASEMHDDLGGGLTTIKFLSQKTLRKTKDEDQKKDIQKIVSNAQTLVGNMSEIIWAMNAGFDTLDNLVAYCRRYSREYLDDHELRLKFSSEGMEDHHRVTGEKRRNVFLVIKESLHNIVKHSKADLVEINFNVEQDLNVSIADNGVGLPVDISKLGNGLNNMTQRIASLGGKLDYLNSNGLTITISLPLDEE